MPKSWNEIRAGAVYLSKRWKDAYDEKSQAQSFLKEFFEVFGVDTVMQATFEHRVKKSDGTQGFIDCFWQGHILIEMKSKGKDLEKAYEQAMDYVRALPDSSLLPQAVVVSDFQTWYFHDLTKDGALTVFQLKDLRKYVTLFRFMVDGQDSAPIHEQDPVNRKAAEKMARLHDAMKAVGYDGHPLEVYLVRLLFCLFAEDTGIFEPGQFSGFVRGRTAADGSDLAARLAELFQALNTPPEKRLNGLDETIAAFNYINGNLFGETLPIAAFSPEMRGALLQCSELDWARISPAIFGAMFQGVMDEQARRDIGAHYTSEENILKVINPLFMNDLRAEFEKIRHLAGPLRRTRLAQFHNKIASLTFLDPACGCGNFLLIAYRELRRLELDILEEMQKDGQLVLDISQLCKVNVSQFHGIEIEAFPAEIAKVALWLMDHLCNLEVADRFGQYFTRIPIKDSPHIVCANALSTDWPKTDFIMGNPPFIGFTYMSSEQKADMLSLFPKNKNLDFVCAWYKKASDLIQGTSIRCAFVSTNSITQGEQVAPLHQNINIDIDFAYRTFKWHNEAQGNATVHCVIIGFHAKGQPSASKKIIYDGDNAIPAQNINGYLVDAKDIIVTSRNTALCDVPQMVYGNKLIDGGNLIIEEADYADFISREPKALSVIKRLVGSKEFINGLTRYCLWLKDVEPTILRTMPLVMERVEKCRQFRLASIDKGTRQHAQTPSLFREMNNPKTAIIIPEVSSENREYIPMGFIDDTVVVSNLVKIIPNATLYHFGILTSRMHNAWMRAVAGRLEMRYRYSKDIVYNNFIWPKVEESSPLHEQISKAAQGILDARAAHPGESLAALYDPLVMPMDLLKAHATLDSLVDKAYGRSFASDAERVALLFELYAKATEEKSK